METRRTDAPAGSASEPDPVMILGISERSGTNFLFHLLCLHPEFDYGGPIWENYLTLHLQHLVRFADGVYSDWNPQWDVGGSIGSADVLLRDLGSGLVRYLNRQLHDPPRTSQGAVRRLVTKVPSVRNLDQIPSVFPGSPLLILVRDGRAVVESGYRSFGIRHEAGMRNWAASARTILRWLDQQPAVPERDATGRSSRALLVRYEDVVLDHESQLRRMFEFLGVDPETYEYPAAAELPVIGSSEAKQLEGTLHWQPVTKRADFDPTRRSGGWSTARQYRFAWLAGREAERLGYTVERPARLRWVWYLAQIAQDLLWYVPDPRDAGPRLARFIRRRLAG